MTCRPNTKVRTTMTISIRKIPNPNPLRHDEIYARVLGFNEDKRSGDILSLGGYFRPVYELRPGEAIQLGDYFWSDITLLGSVLNITWSVPTFPGRGERWFRDSYGQTKTACPKCGAIEYTSDGRHSDGSLLGRCKATRIEMVLAGCVKDPYQS